MTTESNRLQDSFYDALISQKIPVSLYLVNGVSLKGKIVSYDTFSLYLERSGQAQLVFKRSISTVAPEIELDL